MPVNSLSVAREKYNFLYEIKIDVERTTDLIFPTDHNVFPAKEQSRSEAVIKQMIAAFEDTVKVLEKDLQYIKEQNK